MATASLIIAGLALLAAVGSVVYARAQVGELRRQFEQSGPVIEVRASHGIPVLDGVPDADHPAVIVTVTNSGRGEATVKDWGFTIGSPGPGSADTFSALIPWKSGPSVPYRLAGADQVAWYAARSPLREAAAEGGTDRVTPFASLGDGRRVYGDPFVFKG
jgi:hypothetical protein